MEAAGRFDFLCRTNSKNRFGGRDLAAANQSLPEKTRVLRPPGTQAFREFFLRFPITGVYQTDLRIALQHALTAFRGQPILAPHFDPHERARDPVEAETFNSRRDAIFLG
jgi:hypothetical protein